MNRLCDGPFRKLSSTNYAHLSRDGNGLPILRKIPQSHTRRIFGERKSNEQERKLHDLQAVSMRPRSGAHQSVRADEQRLWHLVLSGHPGVLSGLHSKVRLHPALTASIIIKV